MRIIIRMDIHLKDHLNHITVPREAVRQLRRGEKEKRVHLLVRKVHQGHQEKCHHLREGTILEDILAKGEAEDPQITCNLLQVVEQDLGNLHSERKETTVLHNQHLPQIDLDRYD